MLRGRKRELCRELRARQREEGSRQLESQHRPHTVSNTCCTTHLSAGEAAPPVGRPQGHIDAAARLQVESEQGRAVGTKQRLGSSAHGEQTDLHAAGQLVSSEMPCAWPGCYCCQLVPPSPHPHLAGCLPSKFHCKAAGRLVRIRCRRQQLQRASSHGRQRRHVGGAAGQVAALQEWRAAGQRLVPGSTAES